MFAVGSGASSAVLAAQLHSFEAKMAQPADDDDDEGVCTTYDQPDWFQVGLAAQRDEALRSEKDAVLMEKYRLMKHLQVSAYRQFLDVTHRRQRTPVATEPAPSTPKDLKELVQKALCLRVS